MSRNLGSRAPFFGEQHNAPEAPGVRAQRPDPRPAEVRSRPMTDTTIKKVSASHSPKGEMGQKYLVSGKTLTMRLWEA